MKRLILAFAFIMLMNSVFAVTWADASLVALQDVSDDNVAYECLVCTREVEATPEEPNTVYICNQDSPACEMTVSLKSGNNARKIATLSFSKSRLYFRGNKLLSIISFRANPQDYPFTINNMQIPYVSAGDMIDFASANIQSRTPTLEDQGSPEFLGPQYTTVNVAYLPEMSPEYFNQFYYRVGSYEQQATPLSRNPYQVPGEMKTTLGTELKRGYWRPVSLCGQEFFDAIQERVTNIEVSGRRLSDSARNSWFLVEPDEENQLGCSVKKYRLSVKDDLNRKVDLAAVGMVYTRNYNCGTRVAYDVYPQTTNLECNALDLGAAQLKCPETNTNNPEKLLCQKGSVVSFIVGSTRYYVRSDYIGFTVGNELVEDESDLTKSVLLYVPYEDTVGELGQPFVSVVGENSWTYVNSLPASCSESANGCYGVFLQSGKDLGLTSNAKSHATLSGGAEGVVEIWNKERTNVRRRYVLHNPSTNPRTDFNYELVFNNNELVEIKNSLATSSSETNVDGVKIIGLRIVTPTRSQLTGAQLAGGSRLRLTEVDTVWLYPLREGEEEVVVNRPYITYTARTGGETLFEVSARFYGLESVEQLQTRPGEIGAPLEFESQELKQDVLDNAKSIHEFNRQRRNSANWVSSTANPESLTIGGGQTVLIPLNALTYTRPRAENRVTVYEDPIESKNNLFERARDSEQLVFRDIGRTPRVSAQSRARNARVAAETEPLGGPRGERARRIANELFEGLEEFGGGTGRAVDVPLDETTLSRSRLNCQDSDGGRNIFVKGRTIDHDAEKDHSDGCYQGKVEEYYCEEDGHSRLRYLDCPSDYVCELGRCINRQFAIRSCTDTDGGYDAFVKGTGKMVLADGREYTAEDYCNNDGTYLMEQHCNNENFLTVSIRRCGIGCGDGRCLRATERENIQDRMREAERRAAELRAQEEELNRVPCTSHRVCEDDNKLASCGRDGRCTWIEEWDDPLEGLDL